MKWFLLYIILLPVFCRAQNIDIDILRKINTSNPSQYWVQTTNSAYWMPAVISAGIIAYGIKEQSAQTRENAFQSPFSIGIGLGLSETIKFIVKRKRPGDRYPDIIHPYEALHTPSFPSGHTTAGFLTAGMLTFEYRKLYISVPGYLWAGSVGYSRMKLGEHYPSDVLGGMITGTAGAYASKLLTPLIIKRR